MLTLRTDANIGQCESDARPSDANGTGHAGMTSLQRLVKDRLADLDRSYQQAADKGGLSKGTISAIATGKHSGRLNDDTIAKLAAALDLAPAVVADAVGRAAYEVPTEFVLPERFKRLSARDRKVAMDLMDSMLRGYEADEGGAANSGG
jgi:transcriptional regulator with XRE-family HTH domain